MNLGGTLTRVPYGSAFVTNIELQGAKENFESFLTQLEGVLSKM